MRLPLTHLRPAATDVRPPSKRESQLPDSATPEEVAADAAGTQKATQPVAPATQAESPAATAGRKASQPKVAREDRKAASRDARDARKTARRDQRDAARDALRKRARRLVSHATGRHYERVGFATTAQRVAAYLSLAAVLFCVGFMSWTGEFDWAQNDLHWLWIHALMVPVALDFAAVTCTLLALRQIDKGESGFGFRLMSAALVATGAWINWRYALQSGNVTAELFFPVMSLAAYGIVHLVLSAARREARRQQHGIKSRERVEPLPRLGLLVFVPGLGQPAEAFDAWREAIKLRLAKALAASQLSPDELVATFPVPDGYAPGGSGESDRDTGEDQCDDEETHDEEETDAPAPPDLTQMSQSDAIRWVLRNVPDAADSNLVALRHLRDHGYPTLKPQRIHDIRARDAKSRTDTQAATNDVAPATSPVAPATAATIPLAPDATSEETGS